MALSKMALSKTETKVPVKMAVSKMALSKTETEVPATLLIDHTDPGLTIDWHSMQSGSQVQEQSFNVSLPVAAVLDVRRYRKVSVVVREASTRGKPYLMMGKYDSLFANFDVAADGKAHTFDIVGPDLLMYIWGLTSYPTETVRLYLYLTS